MDKATNHQENEAETELIDIFYKDTYRLNSLISQINQGALQSVTTTQDNTQGSISLLKGSVGIPHVFHAGTDNTDSTTQKRSIQETKSSYDDSILRLLEQLNLSPSCVMDTEIVSDLAIMQGTISLKNYKLFSSIIPMLNDGLAAFDPKMQQKKILQCQVAYLKEKSQKNKADKEKLQSLESELVQVNFETLQTEMNYHNYKLVLPFLPKGIGLEIKLSDGNTISGTLKSEYLIDTEESIFMNYGENIPGQWNVLGIVDSKNNMQDTSATPLSSLSQIMSVITQCFFASTSKAIIIPLLIYRVLKMK